MATALGQLIREAREQAGLTQNRLAVAIGIEGGGTQISRYERGDAIRPQTLSRIIATLGMDADATWVAFGQLVDSRRDRL